jgi:hypothetical protein
MPAHFNRGLTGLSEHLLLFLILLSPIRYRLSTPAGSEDGNVWYGVGDLDNRPITKAAAGGLSTIPNRVCKAQKQTDVSTFKLIQRAEDA